MKLPCQLRSCLLSGAALFFLACIFGSWGNTRNLTYMQGKFDTAQLSKIEFPEPVIRKGDILSVQVFSDNPAATAVFNPQKAGSPASGSPSSSGDAGSAGGAPAPTTGAGYQVDERGDIQLQQLGMLHVE